MKAITVRHVPPELARTLRERAARGRTSVGRTVLAVLEDALLGSHAKEPVLHHDMDEFIGAWSKREADAFDRALAEQRKIDPDEWR